jgi:hypothetical protein
MCAMEQWVGASKKGYRPHERVVSPREYSVLEKMNADGKVSVDGLPKLEHMAEYFEKLKGEE